MILFLTSNPGADEWREDGSRVAVRLNSANGFTQELQKAWKENARILMISASPDDYEINDNIKNILNQSFAMSGFSVSMIEVWDHRNTKQSSDYLQNYDVIILAGGHVPTQNAFFKEIGLREEIQEYDGIVIGISAGTMNSAELVYAMPELDGEALDKKYQRFIIGLGLTDVMVIPHYQYLKNVALDGMKAIEEIAYADSRGRNFYALPDGSYIKVENGTTTLYGETYRIHNETIQKVCENEETLVLE